MAPPPRRVNYEAVAKLNCLRRGGKMCRWVDEEEQGMGLGALRKGRRQRDALRIRSFQLHLSFSDAEEATSVLIPETLTLVYLPRVNGSVLEINEAKINPNSPALVAIHHLRRPESPVAVFATADRVRAGPGVGFEVLLRDDALLNGVFRRRGGDGEWRVDCRCAVEEGALRVSAAEVRIVLEERVGEMREKVEMVSGRRLRRRRLRRCELEEIPEETDGCDCGKVLVMDGGDDEEEEEESKGEMEGWDETGLMEMETVRWAVDLGIWAMCLGVGFLFTRASLRRRKRLFI